jgi:hypothetical protein
MQKIAQNIRELVGPADELVLMIDCLSNTLSKRGANSSKSGQIFIDTLFSRETWKAIT